MKIITKSLAELSAEEYLACWYLNYRRHGYMMEDIKRLRDREDCFAIMLWGDKLLGWALLSPTTEPEEEASRYAKRMTNLSCQIYVRASERGKGYGKVLMDEVIKKDSRPLVHPHDTASGALFSDYTVTTSRRARKFIANGKKRKKEINGQRALVRSK